MIVLVKMDDLSDMSYVPHALEEFEKSTKSTDFTRKNLADFVKNRDYSKRLFFVDHLEKARSDVLVFS